MVAFTLDIDETRATGARRLIERKAATKLAI
jgi:hypothetical protein